MGTEERLEKLASSGGMSYIVAGSNVTLVNKEVQLIALTPIPLSVPLHHPLLPSPLHLSSSILCRRVSRSLHDIVHGIHQRVLFVNAVVARSRRGREILANAVEARGRRERGRIHSNVPAEQHRERERRHPVSDV